MADTTTIWIRWTSSGALNTNAIWQNWTSSTTATSYTIPMAHTPSREEIARRREQQATEQRRRDQERQAAQGRAAACLHAYLTDVQRTQLAEHGYFDVVAASGRRYRIRHGTAGNVSAIIPAAPFRGGEIAEASYCIHFAGGDYPVEDVMLAQLLLLQDDEQEFLRIANVTRHLAA